MQRLKDVETRIVAAANDMRRGQVRLVLALAAFDDANAAARHGFESTAKWLAWRCEMGAGTAREYVRLARALRRLPHVAAALESGRLSLSRARAITRIATRKTEREWLERAEAHSAQELEDIVRDTRNRAIQEDPALQAAHRSLRMRTLPNGMRAVEAVLPSIPGAIVGRAILAAQRAAGVSDETDPNLDGAPLPDRKRADALVAICRAYLAGTGSPAARGEQYAVLVHLNAATGEARLHDGPALSSETLGRVIQDAKIAITDGKSVRAAPRSLSKALRRAIMLRDAHCRWPGCRNTVWLEAHHRVHRARGGGDDAENLVAACSHHHRVIHRLDAVFEHDERGGIQVRFPDGRVIGAMPPPLERGGGETMAS